MRNSKPDDASPMRNNKLDDAMSIPAYPFPVDDFSHDKGAGVDQGNSF